MRKSSVAFIVLVAALASTVGAPARPAAPSASCAKASLNLVNAGMLTVGTDNPAYPPWFGGTPPKGSKWKISDPASGKGLESAVTYAVAKRLGFSPSEVKWVYTPFDKAYAPGKKSFDFDINQVSYTPARAKVVTFSTSYYDLNQAIVVMKGTKIASVHTVAGLKGFKFGAALGTTSYAFIKDKIKPSSQPSVYDTNDAAVQGLKNKQIDGLVVDLPTAFYITSAQVPGSLVLGQFEAPPGGEHVGMVFQKGNSLAACVDGALAALNANGTLKQIQSQWLAKATGAPVLK